MDHWFTRKLLLAPTLLVGVAFGAAAQEPSQPFAGFPCEVDLRVVADLAPAACAQIAGGCSQSFITTDTQKNCTGSAPSPTIQMTCVQPLDGYTGGTVNIRDFPCEIWGGEGSACGGARFWTADSSSMQISSTGEVRLSCNRNRR